MQTAYNSQMAIGVPGMLADISDNMVVSKAATEAIAFGSVVVLGAADDKCDLPAAGTDKVLGVALFSQEKIGGYAIGDMVSIGRKCVAWVTAETNVSAEDPVHVRYAGTGTKGAVRNAAVTDETIEINARFLTSALAGGLAQVMFELNHSHAISNVSGLVSALDAKVDVDGDTMTGNLVLGANKATSTFVPSADEDLVNKAYVDAQIAGL